MRLLLFVVVLCCFASVFSQIQNPGLKAVLGIDQMFKNFRRAKGILPLPFIVPIRYNPETFKQVTKQLQRAASRIVPLVVEPPPGVGVAVNRKARKQPLLPTPLMKNAPLLATAHSQRIPAVYHNPFHQTDEYKLAVDYGALAFMPDGSYQQPLHFPLDAENSLYGENPMANILNPYDAYA